MAADWSVWIQIPCVPRPLPGSQARVVTHILTSCCNRRRPTGRSAAQGLSPWAMALALVWTQVQGVAEGARTKWEEEQQIRLVCRRVIWIL